MSYRRWMLWGTENTAEETAKEQSSEIDVRILDWTVSTLGDDDSLKKFFGAIFGLFNSKQKSFPDKHLRRFWFVLYRFIDGTLSSNSFMASVKSRRVDICKNIINMTLCQALCPFTVVSEDLYAVLLSHCSYELQV